MQVFWAWPILFIHHMGDLQSYRSIVCEWHTFWWLNCINFDHSISNLSLASTILKYWSAPVEVLHQMLLSKKLWYIGKTVGKDDWQPWFASKIHINHIGSHHTYVSSQGFLCLKRINKLKLGSEFSISLSLIPPSAITRNSHSFSSIFEGRTATCFLLCAVR